MVIKIMAEMLSFTYTTFHFSSKYWIKYNFMQQWCSFLWKDTTKVSFCFILTHCSCPHCLVHITYRWLEALEISVLSLSIYATKSIQVSDFFVSIDSLLPSGQWHCGLDETDAGGLNRKQWSPWQTALLYKDLSTRRMNPTALKCSLVDHQPLRKPQNTDRMSQCSESHWMRMMAQKRKEWLDGQRTENGQEASAPSD